MLCRRLYRAARSSRYLSRLRWRFMFVALIMGLSEGWMSETRSLVKTDAVWWIQATYLGPDGESGSEVRISILPTTTSAACGMRASAWATTVVTMAVMVASQVGKDPIPWIPSAHTVMADKTRLTSVTSLMLLPPRLYCFLRNFRDRNGQSNVTALQAAALNAGLTPITAASVASEAITPSMSATEGIFDGAFVCATTSMGTTEEDVVVVDVVVVDVVDVVEDDGDDDEDDDDEGGGGGDDPVGEGVSEADEARDVNGRETDETGACRGAGCAKPKARDPPGGGCDVYRRGSGYGVAPVAGAAGAA